MNDAVVSLFRRTIERRFGLPMTLGYTLDAARTTVTHPHLTGPWRSPRVSGRRVSASRYPIEAAVVHAAATQVAEPGEPRIDVVHVPSLPAGIVGRLDGLLQPYEAHPVAVAVVSDLGGAYVRLAPWSMRGACDDDSGTPAARTRSAAPWNYTDAGQWALKLLMLGPVGQPSWWAPPAAWDGWIRSGTELATQCGIAAPTGYDMLRSMGELGWLAHRRGAPYRLTRPEHVMMDWLTVARRQRSTRLPVRPLYARPDGVTGALDWLCHQAARLDPAVPWAVTGWAACHQRQVAMVIDLQAFPPTIALAGDLTAHLDRMDCTICDPAQAVGYVEVRSSRFAFAGVSQVGDVPTVDIIQAALDVAGDPARGWEQAEHIASLVVEAYRTATV